MKEVKCHPLYLFKRAKLVQNILYADVDITYEGYDEPGIPARIPIPLELEYVFQLISSRFTYVDIADLKLPDPAGYQWHHLTVAMLPIRYNNTVADILTWNRLVASVVSDFNNRYNTNEWNINYDDLTRLVEKCLRDFHVIDRKRLEVAKLTNLILFVFDYCKLTLNKAKLHPCLYDYIKTTVKFGKKTYNTTRRTADRIKLYLTQPYLNDGEYRILIDNLPKVTYPTYEKNPYAGDKSSYLAMMFIESMHSFFSSFGIKRIKNSDWSKAEKHLMYEMLRFFGVCKSELSAKDSKYIKSVVDKYSDYFDKCKLHSWLRHEQEYSYLINILDIDWNDNENYTE